MSPVRPRRRRRVQVATGGPGPHEYVVGDYRHVPPEELDKAREAARRGRDQRR